MVKKIKYLNEEDANKVDVIARELIYQILYEESDVDGTEKIIKLATRLDATLDAFSIEEEDKE